MINYDIMNNETNDQIAAVMLQHGTPEQVEEALQYCSRSVRQNIDDAASPYPRMTTEFEAHFGQSWSDPEWRNEAATWAAAWKSALLYNQHTKEQLQ